MWKNLMFISAALLFFTVQNSSAQLHISGIRLGYLDPKDSKAGLVLGMDLTSQVDESVELGATVNVFRRSYQKTGLVAKTVSAGGLVETTVQQEIDFTTFFLPIMGEAIVHFSEDDFHWFGNVGLGYEMLWNNENNFLEQKKERRFYSGFAWLAGGGFQYRIGSRSAVIAEIFYHNAKVKRDEKKNAQGLPVWSQVDLSGLGFRGGLRFGLW
ncbi:MAG: hypothetical protein ONB44_09970 [candidate division KSB1 bacterium]|nr:hypothetical protein [candidate division KSB1 bacterium]MDZ7302450.1 hypothetical protein [candidate division KSB1 bacterium]MDZ7311956.1 hypothetical protein [candidate division KSB1 bacterium]